MNPKKGDKVEVRFHNNVYFDAIVEEWSNGKSILRPFKSNDIVIIQKTLQDVMVVKIYGDSISQLPEQEDIKKEFNQLAQSIKTPYNLGKMAELKDELNKFEREELKQRFHSEELPEGEMNNYEFPRNIQVARFAQHSGEETQRTNPLFHSELQNLFGKKD